MDNIDQELLRHCTDRKNYMELRRSITSSMCVKESWQLFTDFGAYFKQYPKAEVIDQDFKLWMRVSGHPEWKPEEHSSYSLLIDNILNLDFPKREIFMENIFSLKSQTFFEELSLDLKKGKVTPTEVEEKVLGFVRKGSVINHVEPSTLTLMDIAKADAKTGYFWRTEDLNRSIGPLRKGDFVVIGKRPEVGGTSFALSELTYMFEQCEGNAIFFNNEEEESKIFRRIRHAALGVGERTLMADPAKAHADYEQWRDGRDFDLVHDTSMTIASIHRALEHKKYDLIGVNVLLKVGGTGKKEDHDKFEALGGEFRRIAQEYGPVVVVAQADPNATNMKYIPQDFIYKSKTAIQGEADALIMLGQHDDDPDMLRHIHVAKNKMPPSACTEDSLKHIKCPVVFNVETGRFSSQSFAIHSRDGGKK